MDLGLAGKTVIVTGSSRGIGRAIAQTLAQEGARVTVCARRAEQVLAAHDELSGPGPHVAVAADVRTADGCRAVIERTVEMNGGIDGLVNNVGGAGAPRFADADEDDFQRVLDRNLGSTLRMSRLAIPYMRVRGGGAIVHISSIFGRESGGSPSYSVAKAAQITLGKAMARDLAADGIRVNSVAPGSIFFAGGVWDQIGTSDPARVAGMLSRDLPFGRFGRPDEVATAVAFLLSDRASWVSGACLPVDGAQGRAW